MKITSKRKWGRRSKSQAFTLVEIMLGMTLLALLGGAFYYWFYLGNDERRFSNAVADIEQRQQSAFIEAQKIINDAVRVSGFSQTIYPGIRNFPSVLPNRQNLVIFRQRFPEIAARITATVLIPGAPAEIRFEMEDYGAANDPDLVRAQARQAQDTIKDYVQTPAGATRYLVFRKGEVTNILPVRLDPQAPTGSGATVRNFYATLPLGFSAANFTRVQNEISANTFVSMVEEVQLGFSADGNWNLTETFSNPLAPRITTLSEDVEQLSYLFEFDDHQRPRGAMALGLVLPNGVTNSWDASDFINNGCPTVVAGRQPCCNPTATGLICAEPSDLSMLRMVSTMSSDYTGRKSILISDPRLRFANDVIEKDSLFSMTPQNFALQSDTSGSATQDPVCQDPARRCQPGCESYFDDPTRTSPKWRGYGMYVGSPDGTSPYCECGTRVAGDPSTFVPPDTALGQTATQIPQFEPPWSNPINRQINACVHHFGDVYGFAWRHPAVWFWWNGLNKGGSFPPYRVTNGEQDISPFTWNWDLFDAFKANYEAQPAFDNTGAPNPAATWARDVICRLDRDFLSSYFRWIYYSPSANSQQTNPVLVQAPAGRPPHGPLIGGGPNRFASPVEEKCLCSTQEPIFHREVCNFQSTASNVVCPNTWENVDQAGTPTGQYANTPGANDGLNAKIYRINGNGTGEFSNALQDVRQAARCECLNQQYKRPYRNSDDLPYFEGHAASNVWDFRVNPNSSRYTSSIVDAGGVTSTGFTGANLAATILGRHMFPGDSATFNMPLQAEFRNGDGLDAGPHYSPFVRQVKVHYVKSPGGTVNVSDFIRCDQAWRGYHGRCTEPFENGPEKDAIRTAIQGAQTAPGGVGPVLTADQIEAYLGYCRDSCADEQSFAYNPNDWYTLSGVAWTRARITRSTTTNIPTFCGGRIVNWQPGD